jgi:hypothetical protein
LLFGTVIWHPGASSQPTPAPITDAEPDVAMPIQVSVVPPRTRETSRTRVSTPPAASQSAPSIDQADEGAVEAAAVDPREQEAERLLYGEQLFAAQVPDAAWERTATNDLKDVLKSVHRHGVIADDLTCRGGLCRIRFDRAPGAELREYVRDFSDRSGWPGSIAFIRDRHEDGTVTLTMFLVRQGLELPEPAFQ